MPKPRFFLMVRYPLGGVDTQIAASGIGQWQESKTPFYATDSEELARRLLDRILGDNTDNEDRPAGAKLVSVHSPFELPNRDCGKGLYSIAKEEEFDSDQRKTLEDKLERVKALAEFSAFAPAEWPNATKLNLAQDYKRAASWENVIRSVCSLVGTRSRDEGAIRSDPSRDLMERLLMADHVSVLRAVSQSNSTSTSASLARPTGIIADQLAVLEDEIKRSENSDVMQRAAEGDASAVEACRVLSVMKKIRDYNEALLAQEGAALSPSGTPASPGGAAETPKAPAEYAPAKATRAAAMQKVHHETPPEGIKQAFFLRLWHLPPWQKWPIIILVAVLVLLYAIYGVLPEAAKLRILDWITKHL
jgi:hypothetical protein